MPSTHYSLDCVEDLHNKKPATLLWACGHWFGVLVPVDGHKALHHMWATGTELHGLLITTKEEVKSRSDDEVDSIGEGLEVVVGSYTQNTF